MIKYVIFFTGLFLLVPAGTLMATYSRRIREVVFGLLVFTTAFTDWVDINFVERWWYAGSTRGIEVSITDLLTLILLLSTLFTMRRENARLFWPASFGLMLLYFGYGCLSVMASDPKLFGLFELTKLFRGLVVFLAVVWYVRTERDAYVLIFGLSATLIVNGLFAVWQRYSGHVYRVNGTFPHENILGDYCILVGMVVLAVSLHATINPSIRIICAVAWVSAAVATILTIGRMPSALFLVSSVGVLITAHGFKIDLRRILLFLTLGVVMFGIFYRGFDRLEQRQIAVSSRNDYVGQGLRSAHLTIGRDMAQDHWFGVGLNNWGWYFHEYAYEFGSAFRESSPYESTADPGDGHATQGHMLYALVLGELGYPGLLIFIALICQCLYLSTYSHFDKEANLMSRVSAGCFFGFLAEFVANGTEISFRNQQIFIIFNILIGFVVAARHLRFLDANHGKITHIR